MSTDTNRCNGNKADGTVCGMTRMTNFAGKQSARVTPQPYWCHRHRDQQTSGAGEAPTSLDGGSSHLDRVAAARPGADEDGFGGDAPEPYTGPVVVAAIPAPKIVRVTAEDLDTYEEGIVDLAAGDYVCIATEPLYLDSTVRHANGTIVLTLKRREATP